MSEPKLTVCNDGSTSVSYAEESLSNEKDSVKYAIKRVRELKQRAKAADSIEEMRDEIAFELSELQDQLSRLQKAGRY